jgi:hypothetical protein
MDDDATLLQDILFHPLHKYTNIIGLIPESFPLFTLEIPQYIGLRGTKKMRK